jgi:glycosyltransferase involved in cell wall biosynthesis
LISLVVLSYNHRDYIIETLDSAYSLCVDKEVIIIDDGSSDGSDVIISDYIKNNSYENITKFVSKKNAGLVSSLNLALEIVSGEYIFFIASDDIINPDGFVNLYDNILSNKKIKAAMGNSYIYYEGQVPSKLVYNNEHVEFFNQNDIELRENIFLDFPKPLLLQTVIFKTQVLQNMRGWDPKLVWDDYPMFVKLLHNLSNENNEFLFLKNIIVSKYRQHDSNTYKNLTKQVSIMEETFKKIVPEKLYKKAISNQYAFYFLISLREKNWMMCQTIVEKIISERIVFKFLNNLIHQAISWIYRRFSR